LSRRARSLLLLAFVAAACGGENAPQARGIRVGFFGALTGPTATFAQSGKRGVELAAAQINAAGGILGEPLEILSEDDRGEASEAASVVSKLITRDHVIALIGEQASSRTLAAAPIAQRYSIPMIAPTSTNIEVTKKGDYIFRVCFTDAYQGRILAIFARRTLKAETAALLVDVKSDYSVGLADAFRAEFTARGGRIVGEQRYAEGDGDFSAQLTALREAKPQILFVPGYYTDAGLIARQAKALALGATMLGGDGFDSPKLIEIGGESMEGVYFSNHYAPEDPSPEVQTFVAEYRAIHREDPDSIAALSYDAARLLADAIRRAGSTEGKRVRDALAGMREWTGVSGTITFDAERNPIKPGVILKVERGRAKFFEKIAPESR
jgi:branched-chain amino acid transport system substrate-binding protein